MRRRTGKEEKRMSTSLVFGVLMTIGVLALLVVAGLLSNGRRATANRESLVPEPVESKGLARVNGARPRKQEQASVSAYSYDNGQRDLPSGTLLREREQTHEQQEDLQNRYEQKLQELMTLLQQEQPSSSPRISLEEEDDPYRALPRMPRQIDDANPSVRPERSVAASQPVLEPETAEVQAHYSLIPNNEQAREKLPSGLSIPVSITLDGNFEPENVPRMRIEVVIHIQ